MKRPAGAETGGHSSSGTATTSTVARHKPGLTLALARATAGWPVHRLELRGKVATTPHGLRDATTDPAEVRAMFADGDGNVGTPGTPADLILDIDAPKADERPDLTDAERRQVAADRLAELYERFPETRDAPLVLTPSGGYHVYLTLPSEYADAPDGSPKRLRAGGFPRSLPRPQRWGELRGMGRAYVVTWGCERADGIYSPVREPDAPASAPEASGALIAWLLERPAYTQNGEAVNGAALPPSGETKVVGDPEAYARGLLEGVRDRLGSVASGRNEACYDEALTLGRWVGGYQHAGLPSLTEQDARAALTDAMQANGDYGDDPRKADGTIRNGLRAGMASAYTVTEKPKRTHDNHHKQAPHPRSQADRDGAAPRGSSSTNGEANQPAPFDPDTLTPELAEALAAFPLTDLGNGERFALLNGERVRYSSALGWLVWDGRRWAPDADDVVWEYAARTIRAMFQAAVRLSDQEKRDALLKWARRSESGRGPALMLERAYRGQYVRNLRVQPDRLDTNPDVLNVLNGTVDLRTGELRPHDPADLITKLAPVEYDPAADAPLWRTFQERITAGDADLIAYKRRALGYTITGHTREQAVAIAWGTGANGKSTELETIAEALGDYAMSAPFDTFANTRDDKSRRNGLAPLMGARFVRAVEGDAGTRLAEGTIKNITGGEPVTGEYKYRDSFQYVPVFTLWLASNHKPQIRGTDHGIWRRLRLVPYTVTIPEAERDLELPAKLRAELPGILAWLVQGAREWYRDGLGTAAAVAAATEEYRAEMDTLGDFLRDAVATDDPNRYEGSARLHAAYRAHCAERGERHVSMRAFVEKLLERGLEKRRTKSGVVWEGVHLTPAGDALADRQLDQDGGRSR